MREPSPHSALDCVADVLEQVERAMREQLGSDGALVPLIGDHVLGFDPWNLLPSLQRFVVGIWDMGFDAVRWFWRIFLLGALVVIPIWLIIRLVKTPRGR